MTMTCVVTAHPACGWPGRLRHSWLDNQVLLVLRPERAIHMRAAHLLTLMRPWSDDLDDLDAYATQFPSVIDPGVFMQEFAGRRGLTLPSGVRDALSAGFAKAFHAHIGQSVAEYREQLALSAQQLRAALETLEREVAGHGADEDVKLAELDGSRSAYAAALDVHGLLGHAPRGVWLP